MNPAFRYSFFVFMIFSGTVSTDLFGQQWLQMMQSPSSNYFDVQSAYWKWQDSVDASSSLSRQGALSIYTDDIKILQKRYKHWAREFERNMDVAGNRMDERAQWLQHTERTRLHGPVNQLTQSGNWQPIGPTYTFPKAGNYGSGLVYALAIHPLDTSILFAAAGGGGLWRTMDGGNYWEPLTDSAASLPVRCLAIDPVNGSSVYMAIGSVLYKSTNLGDTWMATGAPAAYIETSGSLIIDPVNTQNMYITCLAGLVKSADGGFTWNLISTLYLSDIELNPVNPETIYLLSAGKLYRSYDGGMTLDSVTLNTTWTATDLAVTPADTGYMYAYSGTGSSGNGMVALSTDGGSTFISQPISNILYAFNSLRKIFVSPTNANEVYFYGIILEKSADAGQTWNHVINYPGLPYMHVDERSIEITGNTIWFANDGGVYKTDDGCLSFTDLTGNMQIGEMLSIECSPIDSTVILGGMTHMGCIQRTDSGWACIGAFDGINVAVNPVNPLDIFYKSQYGYNHSTDGGLTTVPISGITESQYSFYPDHPMVFSFQNPNSVYTVAKNVFKSVDGGLNFSPISNHQLTFPQSGVLHVSPYDSNFIYSAQYRTTDGGLTWVPWTKYIAKLAVDPDEPWRIWIASFEQGRTVIYFSADTGITWQSIPSWDLPYEAIRDFEYVNNGYDGLMLTLRFGVYYLDNRLSNWQPFNNGLPDVNLWDLTVMDSIGKVRLATGGRGFWESPLYDFSQPLVADFLSDKDTICPGGTIRFYDNSQNNGPGFSPVYSWTFQGGLPSTSSATQPMVTYPVSGIYPVSLTVINTNGTDSITKAGFVVVEPPSVSIAPIMEEFESVFPPSGWYLNYPSSYSSWQKSTYGGGYGLSANGAGHSNNIGLAAPLAFSMITNDIDLSGLQYPILYFDRAYTTDTMNSDTLKVFYTTDCGVTRTYIYEKGGMDLATAPPTHFVFWPDSSQWATDTIVLSGAPSMAQIGFEMVSYDGNWLYIDNLNIANGTATTAINLLRSPENKLLIYPVPASDYVDIQWEPEDNQPVNASLFNCLGQQVHDDWLVRKGNNRFSLKTLDAGIYTVRIISRDEVFIGTIVVY